MIAMIISVGSIAIDDGPIEATRRVAPIARSRRASLPNRPPFYVVIFAAVLQKRRGGACYIIPRKAGELGYASGSQQTINKGEASFIPRNRHSPRDRRLFERPFCAVNHQFKAFNYKFC